MDDHRDHNGIVRKLAWVPPSSDGLLMRASRNHISTLIGANGLHILQPNEWVPVDFVTAFGTKFISDQGRTGSCTGYSCAGGLCRQMAIRGQNFVGRLSGAFVYDQINGGRDNGSNIIDSMGVIESLGIPLETMYPRVIFRSKQFPQGASYYKEDVAMTLTNSNDCATALAMGILPQVPICVGNNFENFDGDGVAGLSRSSQGNHSVYLAGVEFVGSRKLFRMVNSWGANWGPFRDGTCRLQAAHIDNCADAEDGYGHASTVTPSTTPGAPAPIVV